MSTLAIKTRRKCFISYHHADEMEVEQFIRAFDHDQDVLIARGIGASMTGDIINSTNEDYIKSRIREKYLRDTTVTIVLVGRQTWGRKFVDWEVGASLRNTATASASGLMAISLPSTNVYSGGRLPARVEDNVARNTGYAQWWRYPTSSDDLATCIEIAYSARKDKAYLRRNSRPLRMRNA